MLKEGIKMTNNELKEELQKLSKESSVEELQKYIKDMIQVRGFRNSLLERMCLLTEEMGELAKEVRKTDKNLAIDMNKQYSSNLENEITDVFICLMGMCELIDMDIVKGLKNKEEINFNREWKLKKMRIDKFLKMSTVIKRRTVANEAADGGRISVNGKTVKPSYEVKTGDIVEIRFGDKISKFEVLKIPQRQSEPIETLIKMKE